VHKYAEEGRNACARCARRERAAEEAAQRPQDFGRRRAARLEDVQKITDQHVGLIDDLQKKKDQELLGK
jgi:ribosome recycling factor